MGKQPPDMASLKAKYLGILESQVIEPARRDLLQVQESLRAAKAPAEGGHDAGMVQGHRQAQLDRVNHALKLLDTELSRFRALKLT